MSVEGVGVKASCRIWRVQGGQLFAISVLAPAKPSLSILQILQLYKDYIDPEFTWKNFTVEEQAKVIVAPRSNNLLDTERVGLQSLSSD